MRNILACIVSHFISLTLLSTLEDKAKCYRNKDSQSEDRDQTAEAIFTDEFAKHCHVEAFPGNLHS